LYSLFSAADEFPAWHFTLGVEPISLAQVDDMSDGYVQKDPTGRTETVPASAPSSEDAKQALTTFRKIAKLPSLEVDPAPYASPSLPLLAAEGWRDGFEQMQLGKQHLQSSLQLANLSAGAFSPDLDLSTGAVGSFAQASIDYAVVDQQVARDLAELVPAGTSTVRVRDLQNNRLTLALADHELRAILKPPWDIDLFYASLAAEMAASGGDGLVLVPGTMELPPAAFLRALGATFQRTPQLRTCTLGEYMSRHPADSRPVFLSRVTTAGEGYVQQVLLQAIRSAHSKVVDLSQALDPGQDPVQTARLLLYTAESRYWAAPGTDPGTASVGLSYARAAEKIASEQLNGIQLGPIDGRVVVGSEARLAVTAQSKATYPIKLTLEIRGDGLTVGGGEKRQVVLDPGTTSFPVDVKGTKGRSSVEIRLLAGTTVIDETRISLRFITIYTVLPWGIGFVVIVCAVVFVLLRRRRVRRGRFRTLVKQRPTP
jgi:hypothetical protein